MKVSNTKLTRWVVVLGAVGVIWAGLPLLQGSAPAPVTPTTPVAVNTWVPDAPTVVGEVRVPAAGEPGAATAGTSAADRQAVPVAGSGPVDVHSEVVGVPEVHSEEEPVVQPRLAAVPPETSRLVLEALADAVEARLGAELSGVGREAYDGVVWRTAPCCIWVRVTGLVADFSNPSLVRVMVEWETDLGRGSGPVYWTPDDTDGWVPALVEPST